MSMKEGKYQLYIVTNPEPVWSLIAVIMENADKLIIGIEIVMKIPTAGTGVVNNAEQNNYRSQPLERKPQQLQ